MAAASAPGVSLFSSAAVIIFLAGMVTGMVIVLAMTSQKGNKK